MKIIIKGTNRVEDLTIIDDNGVEWTKDLISSNDFYNDETEEIEMSEDDFNWWDKYITDYKKDEEESDDLADKMDMDKSEIWEKINEQTELYDMDMHSAVRQDALGELKRKLARTVKYTNNIQSILDEQGISIRQMGKDLDIDYSVAHKIATRDDLRTTSLGRIIDIADYLKVGIEDLYTRQ